jgi:hypothetical protein
MCQLCDGNIQLSSLSGEDLIDYLERLGAEYEEAKRGDLSSVEQRYKVQVLNLLSLSDPLCDAMQAESIESSLWNYLWFITWSRDLNKRSLEGQSFTEERLYELILDWDGAAYFDPDHSKPYIYVFVLLACQRFGEAVAYLWKSPKQLLPSVHLLVNMLWYGLVLPHQPLEEEFETVRGQGQGHGHGHGRGRRSIGSMPVDILYQWIACTLLPYDAQSAVDYVMSLNTCWHQHVQLHSHSLMDENLASSEDALYSALERLLLSLDVDTVFALPPPPIYSTVLKTAL